ILKRHLHTGIATITLFSDANEPLAERLIFVQNYDKLNLNLSADKSSYATREKVSIKLNAKTRADSAALGHFSVSVIDESKVDINEDKENTILSNLLLTSDLKGTVEQPNYYFTNITDQKLKQLDLVMLTHGYRRFEWKKVLNNNDQSLAYQPEKSLEITGQAKSLLGSALAKANVTLLPTQSKQVFATKADDKGNFAFRDMAFWDSTKFILQATNAKGKIYTKLIYNSDKLVPITPAVQPINENVNAIISPAYLANNEKQQEELSKLGLGKGKMLKEVKIKAVKPYNYKTETYVPTWAADQVIRGDQIKYGGQLSTRLVGMLHGVYYAKGLKPTANINMTGRPMMVLINGVQGEIDWVATDQVEVIEVLLPPNSFVYGQDGLDGVISITTKSRTLVSTEVASTGILPVTVQGYQKVREFYSPKYESGINYNHPDLRSTIYWKPELVTDKDGNATFDFYNADGIGTYRVVIEGIDEKGNIGRQVYRYKVH
ncbi:MAG: TonB-dependent receptor, partial [Bacteroidetes bacterium]|nr:TonB-dependent receptor [Bacteroidota bacterium]